MTSMAKIGVKGVTGTVKDAGRYATGSARKSTALALHSTPKTARAIAGPRNVYVMLIPVAYSLYK